MPINWRIFDRAGDEINGWRDREHARDMTGGADAQPSSPPTRVDPHVREDLARSREADRARGGGAQLEQMPAARHDVDDDLDDDEVDDRAPRW